MAKKKKNKKKSALLTLVSIAVVAFILFAAFGGFFRIAIVSGYSMYPTLSDGDIVIVDLKAYEKEKPKRFDVVVFPHGSENNYIKRVIGMPGESLQIYDNKVWINGTPAREYYAYEVMISDLGEDKIFYLDEDEYFVLGDNRNESTDSRSTEVGNVSKDIISGKAVFRLWPLSGFGAFD